MEAKLIKKVDSNNGNDIYYSLIIKEKCIGTTHNLFNKEMKENNGDVFLNKLSLKNCQEIELGVDLDTLVLSFYPKTEWDVEMQMICPHPEDTYVCGIQYGCDEDGCNHPNQAPLLDADGCLILKRK